MLIHQYANKYTKLGREHKIRRNIKRKIQFAINWSK